MNRNGLVFLDALSRPYYSTIIGTEPWLCYWHEYQKSWVTLRPVEKGETFPNNLTEEEQDMYFMEAPE